MLELFLLPTTAHSALPHLYLHQRLALRRPALPLPPVPPHNLVRAPLHIHGGQVLGL